MQSYSVAYTCGMCLLTCCVFVPVFNFTLSKESVLSCLEHPDGQKQSSYINVASVRCTFPSRGLFQRGSKQLFTFMAPPINATPLIRSLGHAETASPLSGCSGCSLCFPPVFNMPSSLCPLYKSRKHWKGPNRLIS